MRKYDIINVLQTRLDEKREYEFWYDPLSGDFGGTFYFRMPEEQKAFEENEKIVYENRFRIGENDSNK